MNDVSVDMTEPTPYLERPTRLGAIKRKLTHRHYIRIMRRYLTQTARNEGSILDVGTGSGSFLSEVKQNFPRLQLNGVEYDHRLVEQTNLQIGAPACQQGNAETFDLGVEFDIVTSFQVIEHLFQPDVFVDNCCKHLKPGGILIITTPNLDCISRSVMKSKWHGFRDDHVSLKNARDWANLCTNAGLEPLYVGTTFFSGIPLLNKLPFGIINWALLLGFGSLPWYKGEAFVGVFKKPSA